MNSIYSVPATGPILVRPFNGSHADAIGILAVEKATFDESPYTAAQVQAMLTRGPQCAWVAAEGSAVVGFVIAFLTAGLRGACWEIDLLAVHPDWRRRRLGSHLIGAATSYGAGLARQARAVVEDDNLASTQAFWRAGFRAAPEKHSLLICRPQESSACGHGEPDVRPGQRWGGMSVSRATSSAQAAEWLATLPGQNKAAAALPVLGQPPTPPENVEQDLTFLLAEQAGQRAGYAELLQVQTLLYHGVWIESLLAPARLAREALIAHAVGLARRAGLDEVGAMVPERNRPLRQSLLDAGFRSLGEFRWLTAQLSSSTGESPTQSFTRVSERSESGDA